VTGSLTIAAGTLTYPSDFWEQAFAMFT